MGFISCPSKRTGGLILAGSQMSTWMLSHPPSSIGQGEKIRLKNTSRVKDSLIEKAKAVPATKAKRGIHSLLPISRQMSNYILGWRPSARVMVAWEDKHHKKPDLLSKEMCSLSFVYCLLCGMDQRAGKRDLLSLWQGPSYFLCVLE